MPTMFNSDRVLSTCLRLHESSIEIGSSKTMHSGSIAMTAARFTNCFCPPLRRLIFRSLNPVVPSIFRYLSIRRSISGFGTPKFSRPNTMSSSTVSPIAWASGFWNTIPIDLLITSRFSKSLVGFPFTRTTPFWGSSRPFRSRANVVFPEPLAPTMPIHSPFLIWISTLFRIGFFWR